MRKYEIGLQRKPTFSEVISGILREKDPLQKFLPDRPNLFAVKSLEFSNFFKKEFQPKAGTRDERDKRQRISTFINTTS